MVAPSVVGTVTVYERDLPGVGKKHEIELDDGVRLVVVTHNTGKREVYRRASPDADSEKLFELDDTLARRVGTILEGAYFQPVPTDRIETALGADTVLEWVIVGPDSPLVGRTLGEADVRRRTGASIIAIQRDDETITNPGSGTEFAAGDTVIAIGERDECRRFQSFASGEEGETGDVEDAGDEAGEDGAGEAGEREDEGRANGETGSDDADPERGTDEHGHDE
jgi:TrkA domain protein